MLLKDLVETSQAVAATPSRLKKIARLADTLARLAPDEIEAGMAFLSGRPLQGRIGLGWAAISRVEAPPAAIGTLTLHDVDEAFFRIASLSGPGAARARSRLLAQLFERATSTEQHFLKGLLSGGLRQGAVEGVLTEAVAAAASLAPGAVRQAAMLSGNLAEIARVALTGGGLSHYALELFRPVEPMLASAAGTTSEALAVLGGEAALELKLDGARIQAHKQGSRVRVFSRNLRDVTEAVPEIAAVVAGLPAHELVLDGEALGLAADGAPLPFQETMRRFGRRVETAGIPPDSQLVPFFFDCLFLDGRPLLDDPQRGRSAAVQRLTGTRAVPQRIVSDARAADLFFEETIARGHEGLMAKRLDAPYAPGVRGKSWLKIKRVRTLDLVILAAEWGSGRRRGWLSNLHLGARDEARGGFVMLGKTFKGLTDEMLEWQTRELLSREVSRSGHIVVVRPELVVETAFNDLQESPQYPGAIALRFARVKAHRPDKAAADADTLETLQKIYEGMTGRPAPRRR